MEGFGFNAAEYADSVFEKTVLENVLGPKRKAERVNTE
jgi:hypothetical protein